MLGSHRYADGRTLKTEDLRGLTGTFNWKILGKSNVPAEESLHNRAKQAGASGDYKTAIDLLERASKLAPKWPYPTHRVAYRPIRDQIDSEITDTVPQ
jgi:hypothetical protein